MTRRYKFEDAADHTGALGRISLARPQANGTVGDLGKNPHLVVTLLHPTSRHLTCITHTHPKNNSETFLKWRIED